MKKILTIWIAFLSVMAVSAMTREEVDAQVDSAYHAAMAGQLEQAISINMDALALVPMDSMGWKCEFYSCLLYCYHRLGDYTEALRYGELCLQYDEQHGMPEDLSASLGNLAGVYSSAGKHGVAEDYLRRAILIEQDLMFLQTPEFFAILKKVLATNILSPSRNFLPALPFTLKRIGLLAANAASSFSSLSVSATLLQCTPMTKKSSVNLHSRNPFPVSSLTLLPHRAA